MSERYQRWLQIFKQLNEHSPSKEEIELIAPSHIKEEYLRLHSVKKVISKPTSKVKLRRSFDKKDCLPEPVLKKHGVVMMPSSEGKTLFQDQNSPLLRRSPRKHLSSLVCSTPPEKISSSFKPKARRSLTNVLESNISLNIEPSSSFIIPGTESPANIAQTQPYEQSIRRSPRKHPSSHNELLSSPQKPLLLSRPIICRRLSSLLGSVNDVENEKESISLNSLQLVIEDENSKNMEKDLQESNDNTCAKEEQQLFPCEKNCSKRKKRGKNENYRRLKMKKSYVHGTSLAKKNFRKWRKARNKR